jgi:hypothetical protein
MSHVEISDPVRGGQPQSAHGTLRRWGVVRTEVASTIRASPDRLAALYMDYETWPRLFPLTIRSVRVLRRSENEIVVEVNHRTAGPVVNIIRRRSAHEIELEEHKPKFDAIFVNRFESVSEGTRYVVAAAVRLKAPYVLLAPFLRGYLRRTIRRYVLEPMRAFVEAYERLG